MKKTKKQFGILLHITSLPCKYGVGNFGACARGFIDFLARNKVDIWQMLPLVPTAYADSPYQSPCSYALSPYFADLDLLYDLGLLTKEELRSAVCHRQDKVDYGALFAHRITLLKSAHRRANRQYDLPSLTAHRFYKYALFMSLKEANGYRPWSEWQSQYAFLEQEALDAFAKQNIQDIDFWCWLQDLLLKDWHSLRDYAKENNVLLMGDLPFYVAYDSVEVWDNKHLFRLDDEGKPTLVAGVPPDYFSSNGQLWGNPIYNWEYMQKDGYEWWNNRISNMAEMFDIVRIDHFRAFSSYYTVPYGSENAKNGTWCQCVGASFFEDKHHLNIVAEDLGEIDQGVIDLMRACRYDGMRVASFAFDGYENTHMPSLYPSNCVAYSGTHDNATLIEYCLTMKRDAKRFADFKRAVNKQCDLLHVCRARPSARGCATAILHCLFASEANRVIVPMQDLLLQGGVARMNTPGTASGNWTYRTKGSDFDDEVAQRINTLASLRR